MEIVFESLNLEQYQRSFRTPLITASGTIAFREGVILSLNSSDGKVGKGEVAPLPGRSIETLGDTIRALDLIEEQLVGLPVPSNLQDFEELVQGAIPSCKKYPSLAFGIETAVASIVAQQLRIPVAGLYTQSVSKEIPLNLLVSEEDSQLPELSSESVVKVKVTTGKRLPDLMKELSGRGLREGQVRLDCNCSFELDEIEDLLSAIDVKQIEYIEDPLLNPTSNALERISRGFGVQVALDEPLEVPGAFDSWIESGGFQVAVLKPTIHGGLSATLKSAAEARVCGIDVVISSCFETEVGIEACFAVASSLPEPLRACGLDTLKFFH